MKIQPYIGITDFTNFAQVEAMLKVFKKHRAPWSERKLHVGIMMSRKTLLGLPTKYEKAFPPKEEISNIFGSDETYNCLHYADYEKDPELSMNLCRAISYGGIGIDALQLDMIWPDPGQVANGVHASRKQIEVILQIGRNAIEEAGDNPEEVVRRLEDYDGVIHRVLLDKSMGKGLGMDAEGLRPFARAIKEKFPNLGLGVAGGLGPETMDLVQPLIEEFPDISIDAQGRLRPSGSALDPIDWGMAGEYFVKALSLLD